MFRGPMSFSERAQVGFLLASYTSCSTSTPKLAGQQHHELHSNNQHADRTCQPIRVNSN